MWKHLWKQQSLFLITVHGCVSDFETVEITVGQATTGLTLKVSQTVESLSDAASTKNEQMGKPVIVHQVPVSLNIVCVGVCGCVFVC